jgi:glycosyltransferase involved in cell wall biosynthesis
VKLCFVCSEYPPGPHGGIGNFVQTLGRALVRAGHEVRVVGVYADNNSGSDYEEDFGVRVWRLRGANRRFDWMRARIALYRKVAGWAEEKLIDLVEVPDWQGWAAGWPSLAVPVVARLHSAGSYLAAELGRDVPRTTYWLERLSLSRANYWCAVSHYTAVRTPEVFRLRNRECVVLHNFVDIPPMNGLQLRAANRVIFSGTLCELKGIRSVILAWPLVVSRQPNAELDIFGKDGGTGSGESMQDSLLSLLDADLKKSVRFHGQVPREQMLDAFEGARVGVFPSYAESFPLAPLEAMACGCATIYSCRGSARELVVPDESGLLVDPDRPEEIAGAINRLLGDSVLADRLSRNARRRVEERFSVAAMLSANEEFFEKCVTGFRGRRLVGSP